MDYKILLWVGAAIVLGIVIKLISSLSDAKPENITRTNSTAKKYHRTEPAPRQFPNDSAKSTSVFGGNKKRSAPRRPATTFSSQVGSGGRFPITSLRGYKIKLYVVHLIVYFLTSMIGIVNVLIIPIGILLYKLTLSFHKNTNLDQLSPTEQQEFIQYTQSIKGLGYFLRVALPSYLISELLVVVIALISVILFIGVDFLGIVELFP